MIISPAFAQASGGAGGLSSLLPFLLIFVVFYFFLIRPQQKRAKEHREMVNNCLLYTSPSPRDPKTSRMPSSA